MKIGDSMAAKNKKKRQHKKKKLLLISLFFILLIYYLSYNLLDSLSKISSINKEKEELETRIASLQEEEKKLKADIQKLEDPTYIARYAREKYLYSKDGELIIRFPDEEEESNK